MRRPDYFESQKAHELSHASRQLQYQNGGRTSTDAESMEQAIRMNRERRECLHWWYQNAILPALMEEVQNVLKLTYKNHQITTREEIKAAVDDMYK
jgi:hypothetical protein